MRAPVVRLDAAILEEPEEEAADAGLKTPAAKDGKAKLVLVQAVADTVQQIAGNVPYGKVAALAFQVTNNVYRHLFL